jgi:WD40 repeat protein
LTGAHFRALEGHEKSVLAVAWLDDNRLVSGSLDETVRIWDVPTGRVLQTLTGHGGNIYSIAAHPATGLFATASRDNSVRLWQAGKGKSIRTFTGHDQAVMSVSLSPDAKWMLTGSFDNTVILWETANANKILHFPALRRE